MKKMTNCEFINCVINDAKNGSHALYCEYMYECTRRLTLASVKKSDSMTGMLEGLFDILSNKTDLSFLVKDGKKC